MKVSDKIENFQRKAAEDAEKKRNDILREVESEYEKSRNEIKEQLAEQSEKKIAEELYKIDLEKNRAIIKASTDVKKDVLNLRKEKIQQLFSEVVARISKYTKTPAYSEKLFEDISKFRADNNGEIDIFINEHDLTLKSRIEALGAISVSVIPIAGGFLAKLRGRNALSDFSYDARLAEEKENFNGFSVL
ncbi:MAG: V-type ATP synthase subunit E [Clostridiales bacterium]|jgi:vacuolar-type H+-ATPase subunit E/Vma4|nr:V-type ATP synthase subunit E [Clostridiales bacterium]